MSVSYTHLDVYKRQLYTRKTTETQINVPVVVRTFSFLITALRTIFVNLDADKLTVCRQLATPIAIGNAYNLHKIRLNLFKYEPSMYVCTELYAGVIVKAFI